MDFNPPISPFSPPFTIHFTTVFWIECNGLGKNGEMGEMTFIPRPADKKKIIHMNSFLFSEEGCDSLFTHLTIWEDRERKQVVTLVKWLVKGGEKGEKTSRRLAT